MNSIRHSRIWAVVALVALASSGTATAQDAPAAEPAASGAEGLDLPYSPRGAFFRSLILPGWGQTYVGAPGRGAVYFSLASGSFLMTYVARQQLLDARSEQEWLVETGALQADVDTEFTLARERHFEDWAALSLFLMFLAGADAYVSAYLADFQDRIGVMPAPDGAVQLQMRLSLPGSR